MNNLINTIERVGRIREGMRETINETVPGVYSNGDVDVDNSISHVKNFVHNLEDVKELKSFMQDQVGFSGLALALFDVVDKGEFVEFPEEMPSVTDQTEAVFFTDVRASEKNKKLIATKVEPVDVKGKLKTKKPLFVVHGLFGRPDIMLNRCEKYQEEFDRNNSGDDTRYQLIPVIWPGNVLGVSIEELRPLSSLRPLRLINDFYIDARKYAGQAATAMNKALKSIDAHVFEKDILCVSMGNWLLQKLAEKKGVSGGFSFDNIFMSAPDVDENIFEDGKGGKDITEMLSKDGKVYVFHNKNDIALLASTNLWRSEPFIGKPICRLGLDGATKKGIENCNKKVVNKDFTKNLTDQKREHAYLFFPFAVKFYKNPTKFL